MAFKAGSIYADAEVRTQKWTKGLATLTKSATAFAAGGAAIIGAAMTKNIAVANEWQKEMTNVSTVIDTTAISTQDLTKELLALDPALGSTTDLTNGLYQAFSAGAEDAEQAMQITVDSAKFATAALTDTATAVDVLTTATNAYGSETIDSTRASDIFFTAIEQGKVTGAELSSVIGKSIPVFASAGIGLEELSSGVATMTKQGISAAESTTQLNGIVAAFIKPSTDMKEALEAQGIASGSALLEAEGLSGALEFLETATGGSQEELGRLVPQLEGMRGVMALTGTGGEIFAETLDAMADSAGATEAAFDKQEKTFATLRNSLEKVQIVTGNIGKHFVDEIAGGATEATDGILKMVTSSQGMTFVSEMAGAASATFEGLKTIIDPIASSLFPALKEVGGTLAESIAELAEGSGGATSGFDILAAASQTVSAGISITGKVVEGTITTLKDLIQVVLLSGETLVNVFTGRWGKAKESAEETWDSVKDLGKGFVSSWSDVIDTAKNEFTGFSTDVVQTSKDIETNIKSSFQSTSGSVLMSWEKIYTGFAQTVDDMSAEQETFEENVADSNENIVEDAEETTSSLKEVWQSYFQATEFSFSSYFNNILGAASFFHSSLSNLQSMRFANENAELTLKFQEEKALLDEKLANDLISQEEYDEALNQLNKDNLKEANKLAKENFKAQQENQRAGAIISAAESVAGWWASAPELGPIAGPAFAATMTAATGLMLKEQLDIIDKQKFVPMLARGGTASGLTMINEEGPEILNLPDGTIVVPNDISRRIAEGVGRGGGDTYSFVFNNPVLADRDAEQRMINSISRKLAKQMRSRT